MSYARSASLVFANLLGTLDPLVGKAEDAGMPDGGRFQLTPFHDVLSAQPAF